MAMGSSEGLGATRGGDRRVFTGLDPAHPVELFITLMEKEAEVMEHEPDWICQEALRRIDKANQFIFGFLFKMGCIWIWRRGFMATRGAGLSFLSQMWQIRDELVESSGQHTSRHLATVRQQNVGGLG